MPKKRKDTRETKPCSEAAAETLRCLYGTDCARNTHSATTDQGDMDDRSYTRGGSWGDGGAGGAAAASASARRIWRTLRVV